jgi:hypothetical protein
LEPINEVDHAINLIADATPITNATYFHSLTQNIEIENQLEDLLNK